MLPPKTHIYFECIIPYLELKDMARWEVSIENHALQLTYGFNFLHTPDTHFNPYTSLVILSKEGSHIPLHSGKMRLWCEKRHITLPKLALHCCPFNSLMTTSTLPPATSSATSATWNLFNHVTNLSLACPQEFMFEQFPCLQALDFPYRYRTGIQDTTMATSFQRYLSSIIHTKDSNLISFLFDASSNSGFTADDFDVLINGTLYEESQLSQCSSL
jgi:hypothetical protein